MINTFPEMPTTLPEALAEPAEVRRSWQNEMGPALIGVFLLVVYYDRLGRQTLSIGGLGWSLLGAAVGGILAFGLLYYVPAMWGLRSRQPLWVVGSSTFGAKGTLWVPGVAIGVALVGWFAITVAIAAEFALEGLVACRLVQARLLEPTMWGALEVPSPLYLFVTLFWTACASALGIRLVRIVASVLRAYAVFPAMVLAGVMIWGLFGLRYFAPLKINPVTAEPVLQGGRLLGLLLMVQLVLSYATMPGVLAADFGAVSGDERDIRRGGLVGMACAAWVLAAIALFGVAGMLGRTPTAPGLRSEMAAEQRLQEAYETGKLGPDLTEAQQAVRAFGAENWTLHGVIRRGIGGVPGGILLFVLSLTLLGPACFNPFVFGHRFQAVAPRIGWRTWAVIGGLAAWPLIVIGAPVHPELVFSILGAIVAPIAGAMAADYVRCRGTWPGPRVGWNMAGLLAWLLGLIVGVIPPVAIEADYGAMRLAQPAAFWAFAVAFVMYLVLALLRLEPEPLPFGIVATELPEPVEAAAAPIKNEPAATAPRAADVDTSPGPGDNG